MPASTSMECTGVRILNLGTTVYLVHHVSLGHSHLVVVLRMQWLTNRYFQLFWLTKAQGFYIAESSYVFQGRRTLSMFCDSEQEKH